MNHPVSACVFIRNCFQGAFCLFESMASLMPLVDEFVVMDLGSTDGTLEILDDIARHNGEVKLLVRSKGFPKTDAGVFADLANELIALCKHDRVLYYQADEIWHEDLLKRTATYFDEGRFDLSFWRIQYRDNFQRVKWFPHLVHRVGGKDGSFNFVGDGMTTDRTWAAELCSRYDGGYFQKWGSLGQEGVKPFVHDMIMDVSLVGGFRDNIVERRTLHAPFWHEEPHIENKPASRWKAEAEANPDWTRTESPYNLPAIMRWHVGRTRYELRPELLEALKDGDTKRMVGL
jgi:glycosyltransferase involved in cell wall biosynthesis